ncbi:methyltransferase domain-containing protein [Paenibacillus rhizovicinus]|uniref:Methyltransferase domain-containing protein n=1 Tax=Paenibacillus rhizovicinus TaxID=2704463 RepID=A0A6C0P3W2_9BACL|nr:methyltransferase domain-containing protein [Paenibacillus rhizovicinus]QHW33169.1 methyltransferase domain-containing protein [Paenibacillus rhizovicinus]
MDFNKLLSLNMGNYTRQFPLKNSFGNVFPVLNDQLLSGFLQIDEKDTVLDIGGGSNPFHRANVVTEPFLNRNSHRGGMSVPASFDYVECFAEKLPFDDKSFDFVISRQVFEHTVSPKDACEEMMRVGKRGFIETPQKIFELLLGPNPSHNWFVTLQGDTIVFERRMFIRHPFRHLSMSAVPSSPEMQMLAHWEFKNISNVQYYWENRIKYEVIDHEGGFDYNNPDHASQSHLDVAICSLLLGGYYLPHREADALEAVRLKPDWALARNTLGVIQWKMGKLDKAKQAFEAALLLENRDEYRHNAALIEGDVPVVVDFEDTLGMDERFYAKYSKTGHFDMMSYLFKTHA